MELVGSKAVQAESTARPLALRALILSAALAAAASAGALAWASPGAAPAWQAEGPKVDSTLIDLRRGERARLDRVAPAGQVLDPAPIGARERERLGGP